jgi:peptidoglycan-N-acetylglucosamine deacetylase
MLTFKHKSLYFSKIPTILQIAVPQATWRQPSDTGRIFLTFDDGPIPEVTPWVLNTLAEYDAKATFFCVGQNIERHPDIFQRIGTEGHTIGNHTHQHLDAWRTSAQAYLADVEACQSLTKTPLFRPPFGRLTPGLMRKLRSSGYEIVLWDVLTGDFDTSIKAATCIERVKRHTRAGSIILMHDSLKAWPRLQGTLPTVLQWAKEKGFVCSAL